jgi:molybdopterin synthase catalytic subunit
VEPVTLVELVETPIELGSLYDAVRSKACGAIAMFVGTSREVHEGRPVLQLDYEAYEPMARQELRKLVDELRQLYPAAVGVAVVHRLGNVPLAEASVAVAVSTPHREEAFTACRWAIDTLKIRVPIWKRESYSDGQEPRWVANRESNARVSQ